MRDLFAVANLDVCLVPVTRQFLRSRYMPQRLSLMVSSAVVIPATLAECGLSTARHMLVSRTTGV